MPDWLAHSLVGWITGKTTKQDIGLIVIGALIPDIEKLYLLFDRILNIKTGAFFLPLHTPIGTILLAGIITLFFQNKKKALLALVIGIATHFIIDIIFFEISGGMPLLFPFSWDQWQLNLIKLGDYDYIITIYAILISIIVFFIYYIYEKKVLKQNNNQ